MAIEKKRKRTEAVKQEKPKQEVKTTSSLLKSDEAFPRGGGSTLTPFEYKEATNEAKKDALFEEAATVETKKSSKRRRASQVQQTTNVREGPRIEGLSFKRLTAGTVILGQIAAINNLDLEISLPNNLSGFVSITNISAVLSNKIEHDENESAEELEDSEESALPELSQLFRVGQWIRAAVISVDGSTTKERAGQKQKKRIDLSIEPALANKGLLPAYIQNRAVLQASVKSVEDHGLVMDLGIEGCSGFIKKKEFGTLEHYRLGQTLLCPVTAAEGDRRVVQLSADLQKNAKRLKLKSIANIDAVLPGDGVEVLITDAHKASFSGKVLGLLDATCDTFQSGVLQNDEMELKAGDKILARVIFTDPEAEPRKIAVSLLNHVVDFGTVSASLTTEQSPTEATPVGFVLDSVTVKHVEPNIGLFCETGINHVLGFVHISRVSDSKVDSLNATTGKYKIGSQHPARVVGYNAVDGIFLLSMEQTIIDTKYLNVNDIEIGELVSGTVEKFVPGGILIKISEGMTGLVPDSHVADVKLQFPEKKFKVGSDVQCRVLDMDSARRRVILTMKKSLVNSDAPIISSFEGVKINAKTIGVISKLFDNGALIQFYGGVHGFLPVSEMSEAFIKSPKEHFRVGQTLSVSVIKLDIEEKKMTLSCRDSTAWSSEKQDDFDAFSIGTICGANVTEKTAEKLVLTLTPSGYTGTLDVGHMSDGDFTKCDKLFSKARVGGHLKEVVVLDKYTAQKQLILSMKSTLLKAAKAKTLPITFESLQVGQKLDGFVRRAMDYGVLVGFANGLTGLALKHNLSNDYVSMPASVFAVAQSVSGTVIEIDQEQKRFQLSLKEEKPKEAAGEKSSTSVAHPVDPAIHDISDLLPGKILQARISAIKDTQLNLDLADGVQGRVDVSSIFEDFESIQSKKHPLKQFKVGEEIKVKIVGYHDARNHKFLPLSHRQKSTKTIFECSARPSELRKTSVEMLDFKDIKVGSIYTAFVNNFGSDCLWTTLSPAVRGRINVLDLASEVKSVAAIQQLYSLGSAIQCRVTKFTSSTKHLDLSERAVTEDVLTNLASVKIDSVLPARITRVSESGILAQISEDISGKISLTDLSSNYTENPTKAFQKDELVQVTVKSVDVPNKKLALSLRTASDTVQDPEINSYKDLSVGQSIRGYIKNVADQGLFVELGRDVVARVKIAETSDAFIKDWKTGFSIDQLVSGKIIAIDAQTKRVEMSLKKNAKVKAPQSGLADLKVGQIVEGTIKKIEAFGVFIQVSAVAGVSGLCHKSEIADKPVKDISAVYSVGDLVKAKVLDVNLEKRRISFGLKSSYFNADGAVDGDEDMQDMTNDDDQYDEDEDDEAADNDGDKQEEDSDEESADEDEDEDENDDDVEMSGDDEVSTEQPLAVGDFDWTGKSVFEDAPVAADESDFEVEEQPKKKAKRTKKSYDDSGPDPAREPESAADFERVILGQPDASFVWINYMAFHLQLSDFDAARAVAERALKTINYRLEDEKMNIWMALLNLENNFGTTASLEDTFKRSLEFNDPLEMHSRLVGTFIRSGNLDKAVETYETMVTRFYSSTKTWVEYATFLATHEKLEASREILPRALAALPKTEHIQLLMKFGCLEFRKGDAERGRTLFEGLLSSYPKRLDLWNVLIDMESTQAGSQTVVRGIFDRVLATKLTMKKAKSIFKKWLQYEKEHGGEDDVERVKARATEYVATH